MNDISQQNLGSPQAFKVILVGPQSVGKSSILNRLTETKFNLNYMSTIGIDFKSHQVNIGSKTYSLQIWDTAGQQKFKALTSSYYKGSNACICVFDLNDLQTLSKCEYYLEKALGQNIPADCIYLLGNKSDLNDGHAKDGIQFANRFGVNYSSVSAKEGNGINQVFNNLTVKLSNKVISQPNGVRLKPNLIINQNPARCYC